MVLKSPVNCPGSGSPRRLSKKGPSWLRWRSYPAFCPPAEFAKGARGRGRFPLRAACSSGVNRAGTLTWWPRPPGPSLQWDPRLRCTRRAPLALPPPPGLDVGIPAAARVGCVAPVLSPAGNGLSFVVPASAELQPGPMSALPSELLYYFWREMRSVVASRAPWPPPEIIFKGKKLKEHCVNTSFDVHLVPRRDLTSVTRECVNIWTVERLKFGLPAGKVVQFSLKPAARTVSGQQQQIPLNSSWTQRAACPVPSNLFFP